MTYKTLNQKNRFKERKITFHEFIKLVFATLNPDDDFQDNWHIQYLAKVLESTRLGESEKRRIIVNLPPRAMKSIIISIAWPAWILGLQPSRKIIAVSYSQHLANKMSSDCRTVMQSDWYKSLFPDTRIARGNNAKSKFMTTDHGFRFATSVLGTLTGEGADFIIIDDPMTPMQAASHNKRDVVTEWFDQTLISRLNNKKTGIIMLVMQRLHQKDLTGHLLNKGNWDKIVMPAIAPENATFCIKEFTHDRKENEALHSERESLEDLEKLRTEMGSKAFNAQYQQNPLASSSNLLNIKWFRRYNSNVPMPDGQIHQSWDCAFKVGDTADYSVCTTWLTTANCMYLLDVHRERLNFPDLKNMVISLYDRYTPRAVIIEDKAAGHSLIQQLQVETHLPVLSFCPREDKITRFVTSTPLFEAGRVYLPYAAPWLAEYELEMMNFPHSKHDDQVDSTAQFLNWIRKRQTVCNIGIKLL